MFHCHVFDHMNYIGLLQWVGPSVGRFLLIKSLQKVVYLLGPTFFINAT